MSGSGVVRLALCLLAAGIGVGSIIQGGVNTALSRMLQANVTHGYQPRCGETSSILLAALVSFSSGLFVLVLLNAAHALGASTMGEGARCTRKTIRPWHCIGGLVGCTVMMLMLIGMREAGFALSSVLRAAGTAIASCILDQIGCAGSPIRHMTRQRALGVGLLLVGASFSVAHEFTEEVSHLDWPALLSSMLPLLGGALLPVQAAINGSLARQLGKVPLRATLVSFIGGVLTLALTVQACGAYDGAGERLRALPAWAFSGGPLGMLSVTSNFVLPPYIGYAAVAGFSTFGTLTGSLLFDAIGAFGIASRAVTPLRLGGALVALCGALMTQQKRVASSGAAERRLVGGSGTSSSEDLAHVCPAVVQDTTAADGLQLELPRRWSAAGAHNESKSNAGSAGRDCMDGIAEKEREKRDETAA